MGFSTFLDLLFFCLFNYYIIELLFIMYDKNISVIYYFPTTINHHKSNLNNIFYMLLGIF